MKVQVYFNLHKKCFSVMHRGIVIAHVNQIQLRNVKFHVRELGRQRVISESRKNVHAFVIGEWNGPGCIESFQVPEQAKEVTYNPYRDQTFVYRNGCIPIREAHAAFLTTSSFKAKLFVCH